MKIEKRHVSPYSEEFFIEKGDLAIWRLGGINMRIKTQTGHILVNSYDMRLILTNNSYPLGGNDLYEWKKDED